MDVLADEGAQEAFAAVEELVAHPGEPVVTFSGDLQGEDLDGPFVGEALHAPPPFHNVHSAKNSQEAQCRPGDGT